MKEQAGVVLTINTVCMQRHLALIGELIQSDNRRAQEIAMAYPMLERDGALATIEMRDGVLVALPHLRFIALYESLCLRAVLDLPQLDAPEV